MLALLLRTVLNAAALLLIAYIYPGVQVTSLVAAVVAALVLGALNAVIRPILVILTLPVTILTLGLFLFVINALLFWLVAGIVPGFEVKGFLAALIGSLLFSLITLVTGLFLGGRK